MVNFVVRRILLSALTFALVSVMIFGATEIIPGDVAQAILGRNATPQSLSILRHQLQLDRPAGDRYLQWVGGVLRGDLGTSLVSEQPISGIVGVRLRNTFVLAALAALLGVPLALGLGVVAGVKRDTATDIVISIVSLIAMSLPEFVVGTILILVFALGLHLFPAVTTVPPNVPISELVPNLWLPGVTLAIVMAAWIIRMARTSLIDVMASDYVQTATIRGLPRRRIILRHAVPNALMSTISVVGLTIAWLVGGVVIVEAVFNYPGIGTLTVDAVHNRDLPLVQALGLIGAASFIGVNLVADLLLLAVNPRLRTMRR
jgi:peptide/nickel transport system permease protein